MPVLSAQHHQYKRTVAPNQSKHGPTLAHFKTYALHNIRALEQTEQCLLECTIKASKFQNRHSSTQACCKTDAFHNDHCTPKQAHSKAARPRTDMLQQRQDHVPEQNKYVLEHERHTCCGGGVLLCALPLPCTQHSCSSPVVVRGVRLL